MTDPTRRTFLKHTAAKVAATAASCTGTAHAVSANDKITLGLIGCGGRGTGLANDFAKIAKIGDVCDPDESQRQRLRKSTGARQAVVSHHD